MTARSLDVVMDQPPRLKVSAKQTTVVQQLVPLAAPEKEIRLRPVPAGDFGRKVEEIAARTVDI